MKSETLDNCPFCGAQKYLTSVEVTQLQGWSCGSFRYIGSSKISQTIECMRSELATYRNNKVDTPNCWKQESNNLTPMQRQECCKAANAIALGIPWNVDTAEGRGFWDKLYERLVSISRGAPLTQKVVPVVVRVHTVMMLRDGVEIGFVAHL